MWPSIAPSKPPAAAAAPAASGRHTAWAVLGGLGTVGAFVLYALLSHWLMVHAAREPWAVALLFGPLLLAVAGPALQRRQAWVLLACAAAVAGLALVVWRGGVEDTNRLYVLQHAGILLALAWTFGSTLRSGSTPLISVMARSVHVNFTPEMQAYTRWLTGMWTVCFLAIVALSLLIYLAAPWAWWSLYCNVLTPLLSVAIFAIEHVLRYRRHPEFERISIHGAMRAWRRLGHGSDTPRP